MRVVIPLLIRYQNPGAKDLVKRQDSMTKNFQQVYLC